MDFQTLTVALLVGLSCVYAAQALMPGAWRAHALRAMARWPLPKLVADLLADKAQKAAGCGCNGCDRSPSVSPSASEAFATKEAKIIFMPRRGS